MEKKCKWFSWKFVTVEQKVHHIVPNSNYVYIIAYIYYMLWTLISAHLNHKIILCCGSRTTPDGGSKLGWGGRNGGGWKRNKRSFCYQFCFVEHTFSHNEIIWRILYKINPYIMGVGLIMLSCSQYALARSNSLSLFSHEPTTIVSTKR